MESKLIAFETLRAICSHFNRMCFYSRNNEKIMCDIETCPKIREEKLKNGRKRKACKQK